MTIQTHVPLAPRTTLRIGGPARYFAAVTTEPELETAIAFARERDLPILPLGGGSNLVVADAGFPGLVLHLQLTQPIHTSPGGPAVIRYDVPAGHSWDTLVQLTADAGLTGMECLAGIPGSTGASPVQNIGAYGQEVAQTIHSVRALDLESRQFVTLSSEQCRFTYRSSIFNSTHRGRYIITSVAFHLHPGRKPQLTYADLTRHFAGHPEPTPGQIAAAVRLIRATKGMYLDPVTPDDPDLRSAGSFFKNPVVPAADLDAVLGRIGGTLRIPLAGVPHWLTPGGGAKLPAAWLIEQAGFPKGYALAPGSPAAISTRHTLALTNRSRTATCADLLALRDHITARVQTLFGIHLDQEPVSVPTPGTGY